MNRSTIVEISRLLSYEGINLPDTELAAFLATLTGTTSGVGPNTLQPGETVNVMNHNTGDFEVYDTLEAAQKDIAAYLEGQSFSQNYVYDIQVSIVRKRLEVTCSTNVSFE